MLISFGRSPAGGYGTPAGIVFLWAILTACLAFPAAVPAEQGAAVLGYGVKSCRDYLPVFEGRESGREEDIGDYLRYRDWFSGLVTGLSLATGMDVLSGVEVEGAMRRVRIYCEDHPGDDFFTAGMDLIRQLSKLGSSE